MIQEVKNPTFRPRDFDFTKKKNGISAIMRLYNEAEYLEPVIESIIPHFDEIIIVYHQCTDQTPEIAAKFANAMPEKFKVFHYLPKVFYIGSDEYLSHSPHHPSHFVYYCNFALSKVSYKNFARWDGDMVAAQKPFGSLVKKLRDISWRSPYSWIQSPWVRGFWWYRGVNLWDQDGKIYVNNSRPFSGMGEHGFFPVRKWNRFKYDYRWECLNLKWLRGEYCGYTFYHLKGMKEDRGIDNFKLQKYPNSMYHKWVKDYWSTPELVSFEKYCELEPAAKSLLNPEDAGIQVIRKQ